MTDEESTYATSAGQYCRRLNLQVGSRNPLGIERLILILVKVGKITQVYASSFQAEAAADDVSLHNRTGTKWPLLQSSPTGNTPEYKFIQVVISPPAPKDGGVAAVDNPKHKGWIPRIHFLEVISEIVTTVSFCGRP
jgi:hypothetical protein